MRAPAKCWGFSFLNYRSPCVFPAFVPGFLFLSLAIVRGFFVFEVWMADDRDIVARLGMLEYRADALDRAVAAIQQSTAEISASLSALVRLEEQHAETRRALDRAFTAIREQDKRLEIVEREMPTLKLVQRWVLGSVGTAVTATGLFFGLGGPK